MTIGQIVSAMEAYPAWGDTRKFKSPAEMRQFQRSIEQRKERWIQETFGHV